jgi:hypothetical protein
LAAALLGALASTLAASDAGWAELPPPHFTIAFLGDQGLGEDAEAVLALVAAEGADAVVHLGDFDYDDDPEAWEAQINATLGPDFPYFALAGNHDEDRFYGTGGYQELIEARMDRLGIAWTGDLGAMSWHRYAGISFVMTTPGVFGAGDGLHDLYIRDRFAADDSIWRISAWHKCQRLMQVGDKNDESGWGVYEQSRRAGAIIATAHNHSYARTHLLSDVDDQAVADASETLVLERDDPGTDDDEGRSFAFVSGLGGDGIKEQELGGPWWAAIHTKDQGANYGALFGVFNYLDDPRRAYFYFKDIDGVVADEFFVETALPASETSTTTTTTSSTTTTTLPPPGVFLTKTLRLRRLDQAPGEQRAKLKSHELNLGGARFDPSVEQLIFRLEVDGEVLTHARLAPMIRTGRSRARATDGRRRSARTCSKRASSISS